VETRHLGSSDLQVSAIGLGCNNFGMRLDLEGTRSVIDRALDRGITFFDTADIYGEGRSEEMMGEVLVGRRERIVLATKFGIVPNGRRADRAYVFEAIDRSLRKLRTDRIDLYQVHFPDEATPIEETLEALNDLIAAGKVRQIGCSNFSPELVRRADDWAKTNGKTGFVSCQDEYSLLYRRIEAGVLPAMRERGLSLLPYFPLASGLLTGKYTGGRRPEDGRLIAWNLEGVLAQENVALADRLQAYAESRGRTLLQLAFGWLLSQPGLASVIAGATRPEQVDANVAAADWRLTEEELEAVGAILGPPTAGGVLS
jgi:aryl-alcohol dehydrogenase-like predicted oxidoreductase